MSKDRSIQRDEAYAQLRPLLLHGQIQPGMRLRETQWAEQLGVHRGALREALGLLTHEGLLQAGERGGHFVPVLERVDLDEILELRVILETGAVRRLSRRDEPVCVAGLCETCGTMRQLIAADMPLGFAEADRRFHEQIIALAANPRVTQAYLHAPVLIRVDAERIGQRHLQAMQKTVAEHEAVCDALADAAYEEAAKLLEAHLLIAHSQHGLIHPRELDAVGSEESFP